MHARPHTPKLILRGHGKSMFGKCLTPACSTPAITLHRQVGTRGGIAQPQLLPECGAPTGYAPPQLHLVVMPESPPHQGPATYLSRQPWGTAQRYHPLHSIPTRVAAPAPGTQHP